MLHLWRSWEGSACLLVGSTGYSRSLLHMQEHVTVLLIMHFGIMIVCKKKGNREKIRRYSRDTDSGATRDSKPQPFSWAKGLHPLDYIANLIWMGRSILG